MKIITDEILHLYVLNPQLLEKELLAEIENNIISSEELCERIEKIKSFYTEYEKISKSESGQETNIITLYPLDFNNQGNNHFAKLAANNETKTEDVFKYVKTFACAKTFILMRLHYNPVEKHYKLYLISENKDDVANVKVKVPEFNIEFLSDSNGIVDLQNNNITNANFVLIER
jgi:hypothetical protein